MRPAHRSALAPTLALVALFLAGCAEPRSEAPDPEVQALKARLAQLEQKLQQMPAPAAAEHGGHGADDPRQVPQTALDLLVAGNQALVQGRPKDPDLSAQRITALSKGQKPYAVVLGCADSRSSPELLTGAGLGDVFVVRSAGATADTAGVASVEYAVAHLGARLIVCMAHSSCGAVKAAVAGNHETPCVGALVDHLSPAVQAAKAEGSPDDELAERAGVLSAFIERESLRAHSDLLRSQEKAGRIVLAVARHDLATGTWQWLDASGLTAPPAPSGRIYAIPQAAPAMPAAAEVHGDPPAAHEAETAHGAPAAPAVPAPAREAAKPAPAREAAKPAPAPAEAHAAHH